jgi:hypothetical protein
MNMIAELLKEKARNEKLYAELWETDPVKYGADKESIATCKGRAEAFAQAAELLENKEP